MKNIITAIGNPEFNQRLKENEEYNILSKDIQYQEGILEILEKEEKIDLIIISNYILGDYDFKIFIERILSLKEDIRIIVVLENKDEDIVRFLNSKGIYNIFYDVKEKFEDIKKVIDDKEDKKDIKLEINKLKEIILENQFKEENNENKKTILLNDKINNNLVEILAISGNFGAREKYIFCKSCSIF